MRLHISLEDDLVRDLNARVSKRERSAFIAETIRHALDDQRRWDEIEAAVGALSRSTHEWDGDPAGWVRAQRRSDSRRVG